jgi:putative colanic acid biosysnthesis UDP-glucose lipid carrier transferase
MNTHIDRISAETTPVYRASFAMAFVRIMQRVAPGLITIISLLTLCVLYDVEFDQSMAILAALSGILVVAMIHPGRNYGLGLNNPRVALAISVVHRWVMMLALLLLVAYMAKFSAEYSRRVVLTWAAATPVGITLVSLWLQELMDRAMSNTANQSSALFVGVNEGSLELAKRMRRNPRLNMRVSGFFDDRSAERLGVDSAVPLLGRLPDVVRHVQEHSTDVIFIALPVRHIKRVLDLIEQLHDTTASIYYVPDIYVFDLIQARTQDILGIPVVAMRETPFGGYRGVAKRAFDLCVTCALLPLLALPLLAIAVAVKLSSPGPVIFRQRRYGLDGREIVVYKFRTMRVVEDGPSIRQATKDDSRVTPIGRLLRRYSLDELPQLFNVLRGTMSLVGPRPHAVAHNEEYRKLIKGYMIRHKVPPGITGLAQINGCRGETEKLEQMQARVNYDLEYLRRWSPALDVKILIATALQLPGGGKAY